jgi:hypothetical protein
VWTSRTQTPFGYRPQQNEAGCSSRSGHSKIKRAVRSVWLVVHGRALILWVAARQTRLTPHRLLPFFLPMVCE